MVLKDEELKKFLTGKADPNNTSPSNSLGGVTTSTEIVSGLLHNLFDRVDGSEAEVGSSEVRCFTLKNTSTTDVAKDIKVWVDSGTESPTTSIEIGIGAAGVNNDEVSVATETTIPGNIIFEPLTTVPDAPNVGTLDPGDRIGIWVKWNVQAGTETLDVDKATIKFRITREPGEQPPPPPDCPPDQFFDETQQKCVDRCTPDQNWDPIKQICVDKGTPIECPTGQHYDEDLQQCVDDVQPPPGLDDFVIAAVGDFDCNNDSEETVENISNSKPAGLLALGDFAYESRQDCWFDLMEEGLRDNVGGPNSPNPGVPLFRDATFPILGNHDDDEDETDQARDDIVNGFDIVPEFAVYGVQIGNVACIMLNTQDDYDENSPQYEAAQILLEESSNNPAIDWIIVCYHKPSVATDDDRHGGLNDFADLYHPLFDQYNVALVLNGHNHNFFRSFPANYDGGEPENIKTTTTSLGPYTKNQGTIYSTVGSGGRSLRSNSKDSHVAYKNDDDHGILRIFFTNNGKTMKCQFVSNDLSLKHEWVVNL